MSKDVSVALTLAPPPLATERGDRPVRLATSTRGALWFVARNGLLPWAMLIVAAICAGVLAMHGAPWRADLLWIVDWVPIGHLAIAPVVAGSAAIDAARLSVGTRHLEDSRWWRSPGAAVVLAYSAGISAVYALAIVVAVVVDLPPAFDPRVLLAVAVQLLMLAFLATVGTAVGRLVNPVLGGIIGALVALLAIYLTSARTEHIALLYAGSSLLSRVGRSYDVTYLGAQAVLLTALVLGGLMWRPGVWGRWRRSAEHAALVLAIALVAIAGTTGPSSRLTYTGSPPDLCSDVEGVRVCLYPEHARVQDEVNGHLRGMFVAARDAGYGALVPPEVREVPVSGVSDWRGALLTIDEPLSGAPVDVRGLIQELVEPLHCEQLGRPEPPSDRYTNDVSNVMGTWMELVDPALTVDWGWTYQPLEPAEVSRIVTELRTCTHSF
ncbi:hypothetical protein [Cellulomonas palmilytica]|uniref:hypothetical protein n=1 Tax=Cellulomonas palmilytica TaxID=2608402 RepID=UPI001F29FF54|nr:hypothetical protein [Cellulomonas palmilytica]UJP41145.1 hypothetical protein F1D97_06780 [Cellulomonas palmilytica]